MKNLYSIKFFLVLAICALFGASCSDELVETKEFDTAEVNVALVEGADATQATVRFTPNEHTAKFKYAIGTENDRDAFVSGAISTSEENGNDVFEHTFVSLTENSRYVVFAMAYNADGTPGPVSSIAVETFVGDMVVNEVFTGYESLARQIVASSKYRAVEYQLVTSLDMIEEFENSHAGMGSDKVRIDDLFREFTATFFELEQSTTYYLLVRAEDRFGNWTKTFHYEMATGSANEMPSIDITLGFSDFWVSELSFVPNDLTSDYIILYNEAGVLENYYVGMQLYGGDYFGYMVSQYDRMLTSPVTGDVIYTGATIGKYANEGQDMNHPYEVIVLLADNDGNPSSVVRKLWNTPKVDPAAGVAQVAIASINSTAAGTEFVFTPNSNTIGYYFETFTAAYLDGTDGYPSSSVKDEAWLRDFFVKNAANYSRSGTQWRYLHLNGLWNNSWNDTTTATMPGVLAEIVVMPINKNGLYDGQGPLARQRFTTAP